ncbi:MAG: EamA family transporter RarD [Actinomycetota bacterium]
MEATIVTTPPDDLAARRSGFIAGLVAYFTWGLLTLYWKHLHRFDAFELVGWRIISAAIVMAGVLTATHRWAHLRPVLDNRRLLGRVALAALLLTTNWTTYVWAVVHGHIIETALGYFIAPLGTMAIGVIAFGEHLRRAQRIAIALAVVALTILTVSYGRVPVAALLLAVSWSLYGGLKKGVPLTAVESMSAESFIVLVPAIVTVIARAGGASSVSGSASAGEWVLVAFTGVATVVPLMLFAYAAQRTPLTVLGPLQYLIPGINFLLGWLVFHEKLTVTALTGFALVWVGLAMVTIDTVRIQRSSALSTVPAV